DVRHLEPLPEGLVCYPPLAVTRSVTTLKILSEPDLVSVPGRTNSPSPQQPIWHIPSEKVRTIRTAVGALPRAAIPELRDHQALDRGKINRATTGPYLVFKYSLLITSSSELSIVEMCYQDLKMPGYVRNGFSSPVICADWSRSHFIARLFP
ncbi:hypothetical protein ACFQ71_42275, partial [Streptomyces sp. NPDC056534]|uniref:hypothetical protein n=1 Tax=Streptomyces sp. NPDC056534 TaxID=3345857 RepID=UPI0036B68178